MLQTLSITGYRSFPKLEVPALKRVNLFVGQNNTGKTALLEAIESLVSFEFNGAVYWSCYRRGEVLTDPELPSQSSPEIRHLFYGHGWNSGTQLEIRAEGMGNPSLVCRIEPNSEFSETSNSRSDALGFTSRRKFGDQLSSASWSPLSDSGHLERGFGSLKRGEAPPVTFLAAAQQELKVLLRWWDGIVFTPEEETVLELLRSVEPTIERLTTSASAENAQTVGAVFRAKLSGIGTPVPLGTLGGGTSRLLAIALAGIRARRGVLIVDELETALHHSVFSNAWRMILKTADRLNIQVFATTHSSDCWRSLGYLCASDPEIAKQVSVHRLERDLDHTIPYTPEQLAVAAEHDIEIR